MKKYNLLSASALFMLSSVVTADPLVSGNIISWPSDDWYQVQRTYVQEGNLIDYNLCNSTENGTSCQVPEGTYTVQRQGGDPWRVLQMWDNVIVGGDVTEPEPELEPSVDGNTISWPSGDWYQVQRAYVQEGNPVDWNLCNSTEDGTSCQVPEGTYTVQRQGGDPWRVLQTWDNVIVAGDDNSDDSYRELFRDDFNGNEVSSNFYVPSYDIPGRDSTNNINACSQADGVLNLNIKNVGDERQACYLISKINNYGPGDNSTIKIEYRANVSMVKAHGAWFAGWVYPLHSNSNGELNAEDSDVNTGAEYDVFEYMPTNENGFNVAIHDGATPSGLEHWTYPQGSFGIDLTQDEYHTYAIEWNKDCAVFSIDGHEVYKNTSYISKSQTHSILLTMEAETGTQWGFWNVGNFADNLEQNPAVGKIDWVKASVKDSIAFDLCH